MTTEGPSTTFTGDPICSLTAREAVGFLQRGELSPHALIEASLTRIAAVSPSVNATVTVCPERAREAAGAVDRFSLLAGLPVGIKDLTPVAGVRTTWGTKAFAEFVPTHSAALVARIEDRGGIVIGKTNTPEFGAGANTFNAVFGPTRNPWDTRMNAAGSSGGAAVSLAVGEAWLSHGSDLGGSLRTPASFNRVVGLRPSPGLVANDSAQGFDTLSVQGPMARNVADCALFLDALTGFDPISPISHPPSGSYLAACLRDPGPVRIAFAPDMGGLAPVTPAIRETLAAGLARLNGTGFDVIEDAPDADGIDRCFRTLRAFSFWTGERDVPESVNRHYKATLAQNITEGRNQSMDAVAAAMTLRSQIYDRFRAFLSRYDVLACPVSGIGPLPVEFEYPPEVDGQESVDYLDWLRFAFPATLCGLPALSLPLGFDPDGMPVGIQLIGQPRGEARLLQIAQGLESLLGLDLKPIDPVVRHLS
ncbi:amidase [Cognatishimia sp. F0-27]|uniref:amidase n=1 Tax=Cognatishimia sp. F0-27 TaxID=2816855 RepID=UPI001D0C035F|nr:amidase family protein [Cognatishimia sp. F0-27]MCC1494462.1 amidase [Cognatishimia sp. F0-27]